VATIAATSRIRSRGNATNAADTFLAESKIVRVERDELGDCGGSTGAHQGWSLLAMLGCLCTVTLLAWMLSIRPVVPRSRRSRRHCRQHRVVCPNVAGPTDAPSVYPRSVSQELAERKALHSAPAHEASSSSQQQSTVEERSVEELLDFIEHPVADSGWATSPQPRPYLSLALASGLGLLAEQGQSVSGIGFRMS
jgi:hypothetical protein